MSIALFHTGMWKHLLFVSLNILIVKRWAKKTIHPWAGFMICATGLLWDASRWLVLEVLANDLATWRGLSKEGMALGNSQYQLKQNGTYRRPISV